MASSLAAEDFTLVLFQGIETHSFNNVSQSFKDMKTTVSTSWYIFNDKVDVHTTVTIFFKLIFCLSVIIEMSVN